MIYQHDDQQDTEQLYARQVGETARKQLSAQEDAARASAEIDQQIERVRWLMWREPTLEREMRFEH